MDIHYPDGAFLVKAGLSSKKEMIERLLKGEAFWLGDDYIMFDSNENAYGLPFIAMANLSVPREAMLDKFFYGYDLLYTLKDKD